MAQQSPTRTSASSSVPLPPRTDAPRRWSIGTEPDARVVLRDNSHTKQDGFNAEVVWQSRLSRIPILYGFGEEHRRQRSAIARYFAPKVVDARYRPLMEREADHAVAQLRSRGRLHLDPIVMRYSVAVASAVIGIGASDPDALATRLERFFASPRLQDAPVWRSQVANATGMARLGAFWWHDVRPAIADHRRVPQDDVIGHLIADGFKDVEILIECITYAAAGMVTTREFIAQSVLVLLEDPALLAQYRSDDRDQRYAVLHEILRMHPVVSVIRRRVTSAWNVELSVAAADGGTGEAPLCPGDGIDIDVVAANTDPATVGECPMDYRPGRQLPSQVKADVLGFGDGPHRCPGSFLAIQESDVFLRRLFASDLALVRPPRIGFDEMVSSYEVRDVHLRLA